VTLVRIEHRLAPEEVQRRVAALARKHSLGHTEEPGGRSGKLVKETPFGPVEGRYQVEAGALVLEITARPAFLPESLLRRQLEEKLAAELSGG
jgi:hypothetical protein